MSILGREEWLASPLGAYVLNAEQQLFDTAVVDLFGFNAVQLGLTQVDLLKSSRIPFKYTADEKKGNVLCSSRHLPFQEGSVDLLLMPHTLDISDAPHASLREAERVLVPEGHLILTGFHAWSAWGLKRVLAGRQGYPWQSHFIGLLRLRDWLELLGFEVVEIKMACHTLPINNLKWLQRLSWLDTLGRRCWPMAGGVYCIVAKKRVVGMRVIKPKWKKSKLKASLVAAPSQRNDI